MSFTYEELTYLRFEGERFAEHALDIEVTPELLAYKKILLECAKELWRRRNPAKVRLPRGFDEKFSLVVAEILPGSAVVPLKRRVFRTDDELPLALEDEFVQAAHLIDAVVDAAGLGVALPAEFPRNVIPLFRGFGRSLTESESVYLRAAGRTAEAAYTAQVRERLANWSEATYEDAVDLTGEVSMANLRGQFVLTLDTGEVPAGRFDPAHETLVLEALYRHREVRLRVKGIAEFNETDRTLRGFVRIDDVQIVSTGPAHYDDSARPIWEVVAEIGAKAPAAAWEALPTDLSKRVDEYLARTTGRQ